jgi:hypothetical protein
MVPAPVAASWVRGGSNSSELTEMFFRLKAEATAP